MGSIEQQKEDAARYAAEIAIEQEKLLAEQQKHQDMIYTPKPESYRGLVHKLKEGYIWAIKNTKAAWIAKADDDMYVRVASLSKLLRKLRSPRPTVVGRIIWSSPVHKGGKWADLDYNKNDTYPPWPQVSALKHRACFPVPILSNVMM